MEKTQKWQILAVLENGLPMSIRRIRAMLEKDFSVKPSLAALWKNLQRCSEQGLILVVKIGRINYCKITEKGKSRRKIIAARKYEEFKKWLDRPSGVSQQKAASSQLAEMVFEIESSIMLCNAVLGGDRTDDTLVIAQTLLSYWQVKEAELVPYIAEEWARLVGKLSKQYGDIIGKIFQ